MEKAEVLAQYATRRYTAARVLRSSSVIAFLVERCFRGLQWVSFGSRLLGTETDWYVLVWLLVAAALGIASWCWYPELPTVLKWLLLSVAALRVVDITQAVVNLALFDRLGLSEPSKTSTQPVLDVTRSLVLLLWNFFELVIWFGLAYLALSFVQAKVPFWSRFYFSVITQLTVGYGDFTPLGWAKAVAATQGVLGWIMTVIVVARFVASLPAFHGSEVTGAAQQAAAPVGRG